MSPEIPTHLLSSLTIAAVCSSSGSCGSGMLTAGGTGRDLQKLGARAKTANILIRPRMGSPDELDKNLCVPEMECERTKSGKLRNTQGNATKRKHTRPKTRARQRQQEQSQQQQDNAGQ